MPVSRKIVEDRLSEVGAAFRIVDLAPGASLVVTAYGGRIFGPFIDGIDPCGWVAPAFQSADAFAQFYAGGDWNIGAERLWISPELAFFVGDRQRFWDSFSVPAIIDPGRHVLTSDAGRTLLSQTIDWISADGIGRQIEISRTIEALVNPPWQENAGLRIAGYRQTIAISCSDPQFPVVPWIIRQVSPGGTASVPVDRGTDAVCMFGTAPESSLRENGGAIRMPIAADGMYKIAIPARGSAGKIAYQLPAGRASMLLLASFSHDRDGVYHDEPPHRPGLSGFSSFLFQDDRSLGGYGELEMVGLDKGPGIDGGRHGILSVDSWVAIGDSDQIVRIASDAGHPSFS